MGNTNEGSTVSDFDPEEIRRKISINTSLATTVWQDTRIIYHRRTGSVRLHRRNVRRYPRR